MNKPIRKAIQDIKRMDDAIKKTNSVYLKKDYQKRIDKAKKDLREYCRLRGFNYNEIEEELKNG